MQIASDSSETGETIPDVQLDLLESLVPPLLPLRLVREGDEPDEPKEIMHRSPILHVWRAL